MLSVSKLKGSGKVGNQAIGKVRNQAIGKGPRPKPKAKAETKFYGSSDLLCQVRYKEVSDAVKAATGCAPDEQAISIACGHADGVQFTSTRESISDSENPAEWKKFFAAVVALLSDTLMHNIAQKEADQREQAKQAQAKKDTLSEFWKGVGELNDAHPDSKLSRLQIKNNLQLSGLPVPGKGKGSTPNDDLTEALASLTRLYRLRPVLTAQVVQAILHAQDHVERYGVENKLEATNLAESSGTTEAAHWSKVDDEELRCIDCDDDLKAELRTERVAAAVNRRLEACEQLARERKEADERKEELAEMVNGSNNLLEDAKMPPKGRNLVLAVLLAEKDFNDAQRICQERWAALSSELEAVAESILDVLHEGKVLDSERGPVLDSIKRFPKAEKEATVRAAAAQLLLYQGLGASTPAVRAGTTEVRMDIDIATIARAHRSQSPVRDAREKIRRSRSRSQSQSQSKDQA